MTHREIRRLHSPQLDNRQAFGVIPREVQPSMFDLLTWNTENVQTLLPNKVVQQVESEYRKYHNIYHPERVTQTQGDLPEPTALVETVIQTQVRSVPKIKHKQQKGKIEKPITQNLYQYDQVVPLNKKSKEVKGQGVNVPKARPHSSAYNRNQSITKGPYRPPFAAYGGGNTTNAQVGYLKSHNIVPGKNKSKQNQINEQNKLAASHQYLDSAEEMNQYYNKNIVHYDIPEPNKTRTIVSAKVMAPIPHKKPTKGGKKKPLKEQDEDSAELLKNKGLKEKPLKFMNKREDFIQNQREEEVKKNRIALKPTECYPGEYNVKNINLTQYHNNAALAAGKRNKQHQDIRQLLVDPQYYRA